MLDLIWYALLLLLKAFGVYMLYTRVLHNWYMRWLYGQRGVKFLSTIPKPIIGDIVELAARAEATPDRSVLPTYIREKFN